MSAAGIGRLLIASLHQAISEQIPARLSFYEPWLTTDGFRTSRVSLAGIRAAFSFLRRDDDAYDPVMRRAGELAASWVWEDLSAVRRGWLRALPAWGRRRAAAGLAKRLVADAWRESRARARWHRGEGRLSIDDSLFCEVRVSVSHPLCAYYAAGLSLFLRRLGVETPVCVEACRAQGADRCEIVVPATPRETHPATTTAVLVLLLTVGAVTGRAQPVAGSAPAPRVLVFPFENTSRDGRLSWLGEGAALLVTDQLRANGADVLTRDERLRVFERLQVPPLASLSRATVIRLGRLVGAQEVITGELRRDGDDIVIHARRLLLDSGVLEPAVVERSGVADLLGSFDRIAARLGVPGPVARLVRAPRPPLSAFEQYVKGLLAATPAAQKKFLNGALAAFPTYDAARLALWHVRTAAGDHKAAADSVRAVRESGPDFADAQFLLGLSALHLGQAADAVAVLKALHERAPSAATLNNIGVAVVRDGALAPRVGRATWFFSQARAMDDRDADYGYNLGYAYWVEGDPGGASYWLKECVRLDPTDAAAHALLAQTLHASGQPAEAFRELSLAQRLSSAFDAVELRPGASAPRGLARIKDNRDPRHARRVDTSIETSGPRDQKDLAAFYLDRGQRLADRELDLAAEAELKRALYFAPYDARAHLALARVYLRSGRLRETIDAVKVSLWSEESAAAHLVLAEAHFEARNVLEARAEAERALVLDPNSIHARRLIERLQK
jgi:tetratricopeptide (TPR) repeat protein/predicted hydrocarbon binding protein/TolB-like protein